MEKPKISIIVPVYKVEKYLPKCIDSILAQTFSDFELLLIDDGSPDDSGNICDAYAAHDSRIRVFHKENGGVSSARNLGINSARAEWITFIDGDDWIKESYLSDFGLSTGNNTIDLYIQGYLIIKINTIIRTHSIPRKGVYCTKSCISELEDNNLLNSPVCKLFHRNIIVSNNIKFDKNTSYGEDHIFTLQYLIYTNNIMMRNSCNYIYAMHNNSLTQKMVPLEHLVYYYNKSRNLMCEILKNSDKANQYYKISMNYRSYNTFSKIFNQIIKCKSPTKMLKRIRKQLECLNIYSGLHLKHKIICYIFMHLNTRLSVEFGKFFVKYHAL